MNIWVPQNARNFFRRRGFVSVALQRQMEKRRVIIRYTKVKCLLNWAELEGQVYISRTG
jgi:hypothetical protein